MGAVLPIQARHQARDLDRQLDPHILVIILGQMPVDRGGRGDIGGDGGARGGRAVLGQILQNGLAGVGALGQIGLGLPRCNTMSSPNIGLTKGRTALVPAPASCATARPPHANTAINE